MARRENGIGGKKGREKIKEYSKSQQYKKYVSLGTAIVVWHILK
jgi:hypothetical protein